MGGWVGGWVGDLIHSPSVRKPYCDVNALHRYRAVISAAYAIIDVRFEAESATSSDGALFPRSRIFQVSVVLTGHLTYLMKIVLRRAVDPMHCCWRDTFHYFQQLPGFIVIF